MVGLINRTSNQIFRKKSHTEGFPKSSHILLIIIIILISSVTIIVIKVTFNLLCGYLVSNAKTTSVSLIPWQQLSLPTLLQKKKKKQFSVQCIISSLILANSRNIQRRQRESMNYLLIQVVKIVQPNTKLCPLNTTFFLGEVFPSFSKRVTKWKR